MVYIGGLFGVGFVGKLQVLCLSGDVGLFGGYDCVDDVFYLWCGFVFCLDWLYGFDEGGMVNL